MPAIARILCPKTHNCLTLRSQHDKKQQAEKASLNIKFFSGVYISIQNNTSLYFLNKQFLVQTFENSARY